MSASALIDILRWPDNEPFHEALPHNTLVIHRFQARIIPRLLTKDLLILIFITLCNRMLNSAFLGLLSLCRLSLPPFYL